MQERFREETHFFHRFFMIIFLLLGAFCLWLIIQYTSIPLGLLLVFILSIPFIFGKMITTVDSNELCISFGYIKLIKKKISISDIKLSESVTYKNLFT